MNNSKTSNYWQYPISYWFEKLNSNQEGLSSSVAKEIFAQENTTLKTVSPFQREFYQFLSQFKSPLMLLLIGAVILSAFLGDTSDVFIILFIVLSTGTMSFLQERNAGKVVEKLQSLISLKSNVIRDNKLTEINSKEIVAGDVISLKAGDIIPADCQLIEENELQINESTLTGESFPVKKEVGVYPIDTELSKRYNCLWEGTYVISGKATALVIHTGSDTILGNMTESASKSIETSFEKGIKDFGYFLMKITLVLSTFILIVNLVNHKSIIESALFALALAVGMAPELLPAITTIAMSAGAKRMLAKKVIVKKLSSIQNLGEINLLCTDKTGTITEGAISVSDFVTGFGISSEQVKKMAYWNALLQTGYENPIDNAIKAAKNTEIEIPLKTFEIPYDFNRKRLTIGVKHQDKEWVICKGAYRQIIEICSSIQLSDNSIVNIQPHLVEIDEQYAIFGNSGFRAIALCYKEIDSHSSSGSEETNMIFGGFILLQDPIKEGIKETIDTLKELHVDIKIITGDNQIVATSIAKQIGIIHPNVTSGNELFKLNEKELVKTVNETHIFAEVEPHQKEHIIELLRKTYTVAYVGDGINDVSALNAADVGISVNNSVDVAREAADFVLIEKNLSVLIDGIKEGRKTFANTLKYIFINTGSTFGNMFSMAFASLLLPFLPMLPKQILLTNFITDFPYLSVASDNVDEEQLKKPGKWDLKFIRNYMIIFGIHSSIFDIITFLSLYFVLKVNESAFQTGWFVESILTELFILFIVRTHKNFFKSKPGKYLFILSILGLIITIGLPYSIINNKIGLVALPLNQLGIMVFIVASYIITADWLKVWYFKRLNNQF